MNISAPFIARPVATTLLTIGLTLAGILAFARLPVAPLPRVDYPVISVSASLPGASPDTVATSVATPLERRLGAIAGVTEITSNSSVGSARITVVFDFGRDIDGAARDVQAAINAARADLPPGLRSNPSYRKVNPADAPVLILALTSSTLSQGQIYDAAATVLQQKFSQIDGIGDVTLGGSSLPAVRVELNPDALFKYGIGLEDVRAALASANANAPKGAIEIGKLRWQIYTNDQARLAAQYRDLLVAYRNGAPVRVSDIATVEDSVEDVRNQGSANGKPSVLVILYRQPGANIIETVDRVKELLPELQSSLPHDIDMAVAIDRSTTIRSSLRDVERTLLISIALVILVTFLFLRNFRSALIPSLAVPISLIGTFGVMYLLGYSLDNLSLMALTIATGFVVDDAIIVLENTTRHIEQGMPRMKAALLGAREVGFTVLSMSLSLIAVFIPILLMGGIIGRMFREFAVTLSITILISMVVSLTTTPMMCAFILPRHAPRRPGIVARGSERLFGWMLNGYRRTLNLALANAPIVLMVLVAVLVLNAYMFGAIPKTFFPQQDTGRLIGGIQADQSISFQAMRPKFNQFIALIRQDPAVEGVVGYTGGGSSGFVSVSLKPLAERKVSADEVIARLRIKLANVPGARLFLQAVQDVRAGGRQSNAQFQFTLQSDNAEELNVWAPKLTEALQPNPDLADVNSDQRQNAMAIDLKIDRDAAARLGVTSRQIDAILYDAFGQRPVSTIYNPLNQYRVIMEVAPQYWQNPDTLKRIFISTAGGDITGTQATNNITSATGADSIRNQRANRIGTASRNASSGSAVSLRQEKMVPLSAVASYGLGNTPLSVRHQGQFAATTISFNLPEGKTLSDAQRIINETMNEIGMPASIHGSFQGTAGLFTQSQNSQLILIITAILAVYIVLGVLYESYIHPITILSTLPSAGIGAVLALFIFDTEFSIIALIGVILLIGIVKKNAIMMIDVALDLERHHGMDTREAITEACLRRFRPIMMTTMTALLGAVPLAIGFGEGAELRRPLGISIIGGLIVSQVLTLYTTPVIYLYLDRFRIASMQRKAERDRRRRPRGNPA
ncbi:MAG: efflux RND transporter permease subunit [Rhodospirillales bacterium]